ncbi:MOSC domain-containing protein [Streptomyces griseofuscus]|uniref:MOSC domain-containing protein n=1 Tax=Streptomyces TaxID=1883 RepID=UPI00081E9D4B|nr:MULTISPECIES: MOSC domain-containing protein [unclassified Streptomyces]MBJ7002941.1 MOSC domain-containing protein [Streptomyces sp. CRPSP2-6A1]MYQ90522.1 MOSC domain-containing protein [Streptomyces sp. SID4946]SCF57132.1 MOSC domain-containing protein YiiM [Streptomyces sp. LamerLS-31b]SCF60840.1 MOSC domain-containing protein YiiM [Streptomyces sp. DconLS]
MKLLSVNVGQARPVPYTSHPDGLTGIDKRPVEGPVMVSAPGPKGTAGSGLAGDTVCDLKHHGGDDQAVYAFAREDLDDWERELGRTLANGCFGENITTDGLDVSGALIGERWRIGPAVVLQVTSGRIPCRTFQGHLGEPGWVRRFTRKAATGAYLRVIEPGEIRAGDAVEILHRPGHGVTAAMEFRATTTERELLPRLLAAGDDLHPEALAAARKYVAEQAR